LAQRSARGDRIVALPAPRDDRLDSWKAIAAYLDRGVRTVRRWEREEGLPVHRQMHRVLGTVYAYRAEIDRWRESRREASGAPGATLDATDLPSVLVLPFANLSTETDTDYLADSLTADLIGDLSTVARLRVISRTSSMTLKNTAKDLKTLARELCVRYVIEGSVRQASGRLRIRAQLVDAATDTHVWAAKHDGTTADLLDLQEQLAGDVVESLELQLTAEEYRRLRARPIADVHAYECYLKARHQGWRWRKDAIDDAVRLLENGLAIIGENPRLYAALGLTHLQYHEAGIDYSDRPLVAAEACAKKLASLPDDPAAASLLRGWIEYSRGRIQEAVNQLKRALAMEPGNTDAMALLSNCYAISGQMSHCRALAERGVALDPLNPLAHCGPGYVDFLEGKFAAALPPYERMFEMDPGNPMARLFYVYVLATNRRTVRVREVMRGFTSEMHDGIPARVTFFLAHARMGDAAAATAALSPDVEAAARTTDMFSRFLAHGYGWLGLADEALYWLRVAVDRGFINYPFLAEHHPEFKRFRSNAEFVRLMDEVRARWKAFKP
jgi:TolB-like protein